MGRKKHRRAFWIALGLGIWLAAYLWLDIRDQSTNRELEIFAVNCGATKRLCLSNGAGCPFRGVTVTNATSDAIGAAAFACLGPMRRFVAIDFERGEQ